MHAPTHRGDALLAPFHRGSDCEGARDDGMAAAHAGSGPAAAVVGPGRVPSLVVFDLDECVWSPEMYTLRAVPTTADAVLGDLGGSGRGVVGVKSGESTIRLFAGALQAFQRILAGEYGSALRVAAASSADTPQVSSAAARNDVPGWAPGSPAHTPWLGIGCRLSGSARQRWVYWRCCRGSH